MTDHPQLRAAGRLARSFIDSKLTPLVIANPAPAMTIFPSDCTATAFSSASLSSPRLENPVNAKPL